MPRPARYPATPAGSVTSSASRTCSTPPEASAATITVLPRSVTGACISAYRPPGSPQPSRPGTHDR